MFDGIFLGAMTAVGLAVVYKRLHPKVQIFMQNHPLITDVFCMVLFYQVMGMTITAHFACAAMSMISMAGLHIERHKEDFEFLYDAIDLVKSKIASALEMIKSQCKELNAANKAAKLNKAVIEVTEC
jgi:hypothetical protein